MVSIIVLFNPSYSMGAAHLFEYLCMKMKLLGNIAVCPKVYYKESCGIYQEIYKELV